MEILGRLKLVGGGGEKVDLRRTLASHGVARLAPQRLEPQFRVLETTLLVEGEARSVRIGEGGPGEALVEVGWRSSRPGADERLLEAVAALLRLEEDLSPFYRLAGTDPELAWATAGAGRMLRSLTVFEDLVKTICTTNCAWAATVRMTDALVQELGPVGPGGERAFPGPEAMAGAGPRFYAEVARAGYRGAYLLQLAEEVARGRLDLEQLRDPELPDEEAERRLLALPGVGPYAAAHVMLTSLGRYGRLVLDSWTRPTYQRLVGRRASDRAIERRFGRYRRYRGLAFWLFVTGDWIEVEADRPPA